MKAYRTLGLRILSLLAVAAMFAIGISFSAFAHSSKPPRGYIEPDKCGGVGQPTCELSRAWYLGKVKRSKPSHRAFIDPRKGGEWWECPSNRPRRTLYSVTDSRACATKSLWPNEKLSHAHYRGKTKNRKPDGAFVDIRKGGEYWRCPSGFWRNLNAVTNKAACTVNIGKNCDSGNIAIAGSLFKGEDITKYKCYKKLDCGNDQGRPCQITERLPSCNKGLAEDFIDNKCINTTLAACLTGIRTLHYTIKIVGGLTVVENEIIKIVSKMAEDLLYVIPGVKKAVKAGEKEMKKLANKAETAAKKELDKLISKVKVFKKIETTVQALSNTVHKNKKAIQDLMTNDSFCYMKSHERSAAMAKLLGSDLTKSTSSPTSFSIGFSAGPTKDHITLGIGIDYVFDTTGKSAIYLSGSVGATTGGGFPARYQPKHQHHARYRVQ